MSSKSEDPLKLPRIFTYEMRQDDPAKCTSAKMRKLGFARAISKPAIPKESIVLNPSAEDILISTDRRRSQAHGLVVIDCSWNLARGVFNQRFKGVQRRLPALLAGNPTNYAKLASLSSVEAVSAALYIMNFKEDAEKLLSIYKWGSTFLSLNHDALEDYSKAQTATEIAEIQQAYFPGTGL